MLKPSPRENVGAIIASIDLVSKARSISYSYPEALFLAIQEAYEKIREAGEEMTIEDARVLARRFLTEGVMNLGPGRTITPGMEKEWINIAELHFWQQQLMENPTPSLGYKVQAVAVEAILDGDISGGRVKLAELIAACEQRSQELPMSDWCRQQMPGAIERMRGLYETYARNLSDPLRFLKYILDEEIGLTAKKICATKEEAATRKEEIRNACKLTILPRFSRLFLLHLPHILAKLRVVPPADITAEAVFDLCFNYWALPLS